jgi:hypothetical protein
MHGVVTPTSYDDPLEIESDSEQRRSHDAYGGYLSARREVQSSLRKADCSRSDGGRAAKARHYRLSTGFFDRIPGFEVGRFG